MGILVIDSLRHLDKASRVTARAPSGVVLEFPNPGAIVVLQGKHAALVLTRDEYLRHWLGIG